MTVMMNLGQVCLFSNLITAPGQWCGFWVGVIRKSLFLLFQGCNLLVDDQNFKRGDHIKKMEDQISKGESFFFINQNLCHILFLLFLFLEILH